MKKILILFLTALLCVFALLSCEDVETPYPPDDSNETGEPNGTEDDENGDTPHVHTEVIDKAVDATCSKTGLTEGKHCSVCDEVLVFQEEIGIIDHIWDESGKCSMCDLALPTSEGLEFSLINDGTEYEVSGRGSCEDDDIVIPAVYNGKPVTQIGVKAFYQDSIETIVIPSSIKTIGELAFWGTKGLYNIIIPDGVVSIGNSAFSSLNGTESIVIADSVTEIGEYAFAYLEELVSIKLSNNLTYIPKGAFWGCDIIEEINIPDGVTGIGVSAFAWCKNLEKINIPDSVTRINQDAFANCDKLLNEEGITYADNWLINCPKELTSLIVKDGTVGIADCAVHYVELSELIDVTLPDSVKYIGSNAFSHCKKLTNVNLSNSVKSIAFCAFGYCSSLTSIKIPNGVTSIGDSAFYYCTGLTSITIPNSVPSIGEWAFTSCSSLVDIYYTGTQAEWNAITFERGWNSNTGTYTIHCTDGDIPKS